MSSKLGVQNIAHTNGTNAMTIDSGGNVAMASGKTFSATGAVLKVYQHNLTTEVSQSTTTYKSSGLFLTINPISSSSKFLIRFDAQGHNGTNNGFIVANVVYNPSSSTDGNTTLSGGTLLTTGNYGMASAYGGGATTVSSLSASILHSPNTASAVTYMVGYKQHGGGIAYFAINSTYSSLTIMEIGG